MAALMHTHLPHTGGSGGGVCGIVGARHSDCMLIAKMYCCAEVW